MDMSEYHTPVLLKDSVSALAIRKGGVYVDATFGGGGHSREILSRLEGNSKLIAYDRDPEALKNAPDDKRLILVHNNFRFLQNYIRLNGFDKVDGILADLGVSSHQFDTEERGFSFRFDARLDMRMSRMSKISAEDIVNDYDEDQLTKVLREWGEVDNSRRVAKLICSEREKRR
ncbi:MAG: 16S rRNA (cytosine(1402)-N(4))-methyltransferase RsmH, partial [Bacteroidales bacterium]|nr:16S rRNA (cytosine(1402)-N(4))-methyltransferase RsmH [Bacteroidales bacterium]